MMAAPAGEKSVPGEPVRNPHAGAAAGRDEQPAAERPGTKDALDETAELFRSVFKGELLP
jgi:hypothetical protein